MGEYGASNDAIAAGEADMFLQAWVTTPQGDPGAVLEALLKSDGGAIALGHPLGCTGAKLSVQLFDEMRKRDMQGKYGMVTMCVGTGQGAAGIFEFLN